MKIYAILSAILSLAALHARAAVAPINAVYTQTATIAPLSSLASISSLKANGSVTLNSDSSLVRIILIDAAGKKHLIYEQYPLCAVSKQATFTNAAEETLDLLNVKPSMIKIIVRNASLTLSSLDYSTAASTKTSTQIDAAVASSVRQMALGRIARINANSAAYSLRWTAGETALGNLPFQQRVSVQNLTDTYNSSGDEYYVSGIFQRMQDYVLYGPPSKIATKSSQLKADDGSITSSSKFPLHFDWRNAHGAQDPLSYYYDRDEHRSGWATASKDQLWNTALKCGSCWAFATVGLIEMHANLQLNRHVDIDLSEQRVVSCRMGGDCAGGFGAEALHSIKYNGGLPNEGCFPYVGYEQPCANQCVTPAYKVSVSNVITALEKDHYRSVDSIKSMLVNRGPLPIVTESHSMLLLGWKTVEDPNRIIWIFKDSNGYNSGTDEGTKEVEDGLTWENFSYFDEEKELMTYYFTVDAYLPDEDPILFYTMDASKACVDADGDGYYNWGRGARPATCPPCAPQMRDWDDNNPTVAARDWYGNLLPVTPLEKQTVLIKSHTYIKVPTEYCSSIMLNTSSGGNDPMPPYLIVQNKLTLPGTSVLSAENADVKFIGGTLVSGSLEARNGSKFLFLDNSQINLWGKSSLRVYPGGRVLFYNNTVINSK